MVESGLAAELDQGFSWISLGEINPSLKQGYMFPDPQDPNSPLYQFIDTQPADTYPVDPAAGDSSLSHFTVRQFTREGITNTFPIVVTITNHGLQNGQYLRATQFISMPLASATGMQQLGNGLFCLQQADANTFQLYGINGLPVDGRGYTPWVSGGQFTLVGQDLPIVNPSAFPPYGNPPNPLI